MAARPDIALVSLGTTMGWRRTDESFAELVREAGASCEIVPVRLGPARRLRVTMAATDIVEAAAARRAAGGVEARAVVYSSITAALLQRPRVPSAVRFDTLAALNRPGWGGAWQRRREPGALRRANLLLPLSRAAAEAAGRVLGGERRGVVVTPPLAEIEQRPRQVDAAAYAGNPEKRGLDVLCRAWALAAPDGARLVVGGIEPDAARAYLRRTGAPEPPGVEFAGALPAERWLETVAGAGVFVNASRYEDFGMAQLEALAAGAPLVTLPTAGPNEALPLARRVAPELVAEEATAEALAGVVRAGLALDAEGRTRYAREARRLLGPYRREAVGRVVAEEVLPALLSES